MDPLPINDKEMKLAFLRWCQDYGHKDLDREVAFFNSIEIKAYNLEDGAGWLKRVRQGLFLSAETVARRLGVTKTAYLKFEKNEGKGTVTLQTLAKTAEAMGCELVYAIRPKQRTSFSNLIWSKLLPSAMGQVWRKKCKPNWRGLAIASIANESMLDCQFRREQGWTQKRQPTTQS